MPNFTIYFEMYGKRMKTTVEAVNEISAKAKIRDKIIFHKIEKESSEDEVKRMFREGGLDDLMNAMGMK